MVVFGTVAVSMCRVPDLREAISRRSKMNPKRYEDAPPERTSTDAGETMQRQRSAMVVGPVSRIQGGA